MDREEETLEVEMEVGEEVERIMETKREDHVGEEGEALVEEEVEGEEVVREEEVEEVVEDSPLKRDSAVEVIDSSIRKRLLYSSLPQLIDSVNLAETDCQSSSDPVDCKKWPRRSGDLPKGKILWLEFLASNAPLFDSSTHSSCTGG